MKEDQVDGQIIRSYEVEAEYAHGTRIIVSRGYSVGNKRIDPIGPPLSRAIAVRLRVTQLAPGSASARVTHFGAYSECSNDTDSSPFSAIHFTGAGN